MQLFDALFCDMDGTLLLSEPLHWDAWLETLATRGATLPARLDAAAYIGMADAAIAQEACDRFGAMGPPSELQERKQAVFMQLCQLRPPVPPVGRDAFLARARGQQLLAVVTSTSRGEAEGMLCGAGIRDAFAFLVTADDTALHKPDPAPYREALRRARVRPERALVIEDSAFGLEAARRAGLAAVGMHTAPGVRAAFPGLPHFDDFVALARWLEGGAQRRCARP
jgi:beta-phosphoglucomutase